MSAIMDLMEVHPEGESSEGFRFECGGGRIGVLALHMEWRPGNAVSATAWQEAMEKLWSHPDVRAGLKLNRGDIGFAQEKVMAWHEQPRVERPHYIFKLSAITSKCTTCGHFKVHHL